MNFSQEDPNIERAARDAWLEFKGQDHKYSPELGQWYSFKKHHWEADVDGLETLHSVYELMPSLEGAMTSHTQTARKNLYSGRHARNVLALAAASPQMRVFNHQWDARPWQLATPAGVIDLENGNLRDGLREDFLRESASISPSPEPPTHYWPFLLSSLNGDETKAMYLTALAYYCLTGAQDVKRFWVLSGPANSGKTTFVNLLVNILGDLATPAPPDAFQLRGQGRAEQEEAAEWVGKRLLVVSELPAGRWKTSNLKAITGGDKIPARRLRHQAFNYRPICKLLFTTNSAVEFAGGIPDSGVVSRITHIEFTKPEHINPDLPFLLQGELDKIFGFIITKGGDWYHAHGLEPTGNVELETRAAIEEADMLEAFIEECCDVGPEYEASVSSLTAAYNHFNRPTGAKPISPIAFGKALDPVRFPSARTGRAGRRVRINLSVSSAYELKMMGGF